ncbi:WAT1-related protein [Citrus sinensis]|nr:WAT1-related protein [Citrus sinensis]
MKSLLCRNAFTASQKPYIALIFVQFAYAGMALFSKAAIAKGMNPFVFVVYRQAFASLALSPFAFFLESQNASPLSYSSVCKIFLVSLFGLTLSLNLYYVAINYTTATFAAATTNTIPAITFVLAGLLRIESISIKYLHGIAKVLGSVVSVSGALVFAFVKGPPLRFLNWYPEIQKQVSESSPTNDCPIGRWIKGALIMISANTAWSLWLVLQGYIIKQYPAKVRLTTLQCFFSCIQSAFWAVAAERNPSAWKLGWDIHLVSVVYCVNLASVFSVELINFKRDRHVNVQSDIYDDTYVGTGQTVVPDCWTINSLQRLLGSAPPSLLGLVINGITYWIQVWAIEKKGPVFTAIFTPFALIITAIFSAFLWKETLHWGSVGGAVLLVGGLYSVLWGKNREERINKIVGNDNDEENPEGKEEITMESTINNH